MQIGSVEGIFIAEEAGTIMRPVQTISVVAGVGLAGDRYANGVGAYSGKGTKIRQVSFFEVETIEAICREYALALTPELTRRNILTRGIALNHLIERTFTTSSGIVFRGVDPCPPCTRPGKLSGDQELEKHLCDLLKHRGGLRAEVLTGGVLSLWDRIIVSDE